MKKNPFNICLTILTFVLDFIIVRNTAGRCWINAQPGANSHFVTSSKLVAMCGDNRFIAAALVGALMGLIYLVINLIRKDETGKDELVKDLIRSAIVFVLLIVWSLVLAWPISIVH